MAFIFPDPTELQGQILQWIAAATVIVGALAVFMVRLAPLIKSVRDAWGAINGLRVGAASVATKLEEHGTKIAVHEVRLNGDLDARMALAARLAVEHARNGTGPGIAGTPLDGRSSLSGQAQPGHDGPGNPGEIVRP